MSAGKLRISIISTLTITLSVGICHSLQAQREANPRPNPLAYVPRNETQAADFLKAHPDADGRGICIAIFDTGVDPGAVGMQTTTTGAPKLIDLIDGTGNGDVKMRRVSKDRLKQPLVGATGRVLKLEPRWLKADSKLSLGSTAAFEILPAEVVAELKESRKRQLDKITSSLEQALRTEPRPDGLVGELSKDSTSDLIAQADRFRNGYSDPGPIYDCLTVHDGKLWRACIDTDQDGDFTDESLLEDYRFEQRYSTFPGAVPVNFALNIYDDGELLSVVVDSGAHGTHVASITAGHVPDSPESNGVAPGAQLISVKIGDPRVGGMETGIAIQRGLRAVERHQCHLVNMSFGEPTATPLSGQIVEDITETVRRTGLIFVSSAMNSGPALSTVGAPGGTAQGVFGVGAHISPEMARQSYASAHDPGELGYIWTSRGPTHDGSFGVDIFAPGGAYAAVPAWTGQRIQRMHGTSMASPNLCGCLALMLSGLKAENHEWSPQTVMRAIQSTARPLEDVDRWTQGPGLIQTLDAYSRLTMLIADQHQLPPIKLRVPHPSRPGRGIYLREASEVDQPLSTTVRITPDLDDENRSAWAARFPLNFTLKSTAEWVRTGERVVVPANGQTFEVHVDPTQLEPGAHSAEILLYENGRQEAGPALRFPVTVVRPRPEDSGKTQVDSEVQLETGTIHRWFVDVPTDASQVRVRIQRDGQTDRRLIVLHALQLQENEPFRRTEHRYYIGLGSAQQTERVMNVIPGRMMELCLAQDWSSEGSTDLNVSVDFLRATTDSEVSVGVTTGLAHVAVGNPTDAPVRWSMSGSLTRHHKVLAPSTSNLQTRTDARDQGTRPTAGYRLDLEWKLNVKSTVSFNAQLSGQGDLLYDSPWGGYLWSVENDQGRIVHYGDAFPSSCRLKKGTYTIRTTLHHDSASTLKKAQSTRLILDYAIPGSQSVTIYKSRGSAILQTGSVSSLRLEPGERRFLVAATPGSLKSGNGPGNLPIEPGPGDELTGSLQIKDAGPESTLVRSINIRASISSTTASASSGTKDEGNAVLKRLSAIAPGKVEEFDREFEKATRKDKKNLDLLIARLHWLDLESHRKERLARVVAAADAVIAQIDQAMIREVLFNGRELGGVSTSQARTQLKHLTDSLYRKGRALGYMELPAVIEKTPIADPKAHDKQFEETIKQLDAWVDLTAKEYVLLRVRRERRKGRLTSALKLLADARNRYGDAYWYDKKSRDIYAELGWMHCSEYYQAWMFRKYPRRMYEESLKPDAAKTSAK